VVRLQNIAKRYGEGPEILHDLSLELAPGSFHFVTGGAGAGKTTLLSILALAERPSRGAVTLFDTDAEAASRRVRARLRRRIGTVFQDGRLVEDLNVAENIALPLRIDGASAQQRGEHVAALLDWLGLADRGNLLPAALSGSQRQRVALARAVIRRPGLLLADEPLVAGDEELALLIVDAFERMTQLGTIVVVATRHSAFADRFTYPRLHLAGGMMSDGGTSS
jgi:cell division transport system ATP-binding protein